MEEIQKKRVKKGEGQPNWANTGAQQGLSTPSPSLFYFSILFPR
jgi:hypothetical protein